MPNILSVIRSARSRPDDPLRRAVRELSGAGAPLTIIDRDVIRPAAVDEECRAALWLYAWHATEADTSRERLAA